jgi:hypothetical protein
MHEGCGGSRGIAGYDEPSPGPDALLIGFAGAMRRSELVRLDVRDLNEDQQTRHNSSPLERQFQLPCVLRQVAGQG